MKIISDRTIRPCLVGKKQYKAFFHGWYHGDELYAILEYPSGNVKLAPYNKTLIKFVDNPFPEYDFTPKTGTWRKDVDFDGGDIFFCSACGEGQYYEFKRCPKCKIDMAISCEEKPDE